jgi:hypothetical protein
MLPRMDFDLTTQLLQARAQQTQHSIAIAIVRKNHEMQMSLLQTLDAVARSSPAPEGQGLVVDRRA